MKRALLLLLGLLASAAALQPSPAVRSVRRQYTARRPRLVAAAPAAKPGRALSLCAALAAGVSAGAELIEDVSDVGHAHGVVLLVWSKVAKELREAVEAAEAAGQALEGSVHGAVARLLRGALSLLSKRLVVRALSLCALLAAAKEVAEDVEPGGHHGAVLLASTELLENLEAAGVRCFGLVPLLLEAGVLRLVVAASATILAGLELVRDVRMGSLKVGGHHGVALLAGARLLKEGLPFVQRLTGQPE